MRTYGSAFLLLSLTVSTLSVPALAETSPVTAGSGPAVSYSTSAVEASSNTPDAPAASSITAPAATSGSIRPFSKVGVGVSAGTLGIGGQVATPIAKSLNLRVQGNFFSYNSLSYTSGGVTYNGDLKLRSVITSVDWFPFGGSFHLSPGVQLYGGLEADANASVPAGTSFSLNNNTYWSSSANPVNGTGSVSANTVAPVFTFGWGNLISRNEHSHISVPVELGFVYQGEPKVDLALTGYACNAQGQNCKNAATDSGIQTDIAGQKQIISNDISPYFKFYPVISIGFGYKF